MAVNTKLVVVEELINRLDSTDQFKVIYKNIVPVWTNIKQFPAVSVMFESETKERDNLTNRKAFYNGIVSVYVFNKQSPNKYEDILSDLIEVVYTEVENMRWEQMLVVDATVSSMKREGGIVHPYAIAKIEVNVRYIKPI